jgi:hypothetical protein
MEHAANKIKKKKKHTHTLQNNTHTHTLQNNTHTHTLQNKLKQ